MLKNISIYNTIFITALLVFSSCEEMIEIDPPLDQVVSEVIYQSDVTAKAALSGLYSTLSQSTAQLNMSLYTSLSSDELLYTKTTTPYSEFAANIYVATSGGPSTLFSDFYSAIYKANSIIAGASAGTLSESVKKELIAEAKFLRAYCYFNLVNFFGNVPLVITTDISVTASLPRASVASVYAQMVQDLTEAKADLQSDYSAASGYRYVPNKAAAAALLARVYLFTGNYAMAESNATEVIEQTSLYNLIPAANIATNVFMKDNKEAIMQFMGYGLSTYLWTYEGYSIVPSTLTGTVSVTFHMPQAFVDSFDGSDLRRANWIKEYVVSGTTYYVPYKYKNNSNTTLTVTQGEYLVVLRLAEQYLIRAEARAKIGTDLSGALADLNAIRTRAGLSESTTSTQEDLILEIEDENKKEFFVEQGHRWFDLKRLGRIDAVMDGLKDSPWEPYMALYPIPQTAINANRNLEPNNDGY